MNPASPPELPPNGSLLTDLDLINEMRAAIELDLTQQTLISYRKAGRGPEYILLGRRVLYSRAKLKEWLEAGGTRTIAAQDKPVAKVKPAKAAPERRLARAR